MNKWGGKDYNYREEYFKRNKGFLGFYICAYCYRPVRKKNTHVDHIMPKSRALGANAYYNTIVSCPKCNMKKSNKIDYRVIQGYGAKGVQETLRLGRGGVKVGAKGSYFLLRKMLGITYLILTPILELLRFFLRKIWWALLIVGFLWGFSQIKLYL